MKSSQARKSKAVLLARSRLVIKPANPPKVPRLILSLLLKDLLTFLLTAGGDCSDELDCGFSAKVCAY